MVFGGQDGFGAGDRDGSVPEGNGIFGNALREAWLSAGFLSWTGRRSSGKFQLFIHILCFSIGEICTRVHSVLTYVAYILFIVYMAFVE